MSEPLLKTKYHVQRQLAREAGYDVDEHARLTHQIVAETAAAYNIKLKYAKPALKTDDPPVERFFNSVEKKGEIDAFDN